MVVLNPCLDCTPFDSGGTVLSCELLDDFGNRNTDPDAPSPLGWSNASYVYTNGQHLAWTANHPELSWVDSGRGLIRMPAASSLTITVTTQAPLAYGSLVSKVEGSGYWYTVEFWAGPMPATTMFRLRDANGEAIVTMGTGAVTAQRFGSAAGTYSGSTTFLDDQFDNPYTLIMYIDPTVTRVEIKQGTTTMLSSVTSAATNPTLVTTTDPSISLIGTGGGEPGYTMRFERIELAPCERPLALSQLLNGYRGRRDLEASSMGGATSIVRGPEYPSFGQLDALWDSHDIADVGGDQGNREFEWRSWLTWLVPPGTSFVRLVGTIKTITLIGFGFSSPATTATYEMGPVAFNPDIDPTSFDLIGTGLGGSIPFDLDAQTVEDYEITSSAIGATYDAGDGIAWHLFQLSIKNNSLQGIGTHTWFAAPGHADGNALEVNDRFPNNPNWHRTGHPLGDYADWSGVMSGVRIDVEAWAFGVNGGSPVVAAPRSGQPVLNEFVAIGDGVTTAFSVMRAYAPLSLDIDIDGMHLGGVGETNPATGAFGLTFAPAAGERITASYQGAAV